MNIVWVFLKENRYGSNLSGEALHSMALHMTVMTDCPICQQRIRMEWNKGLWSENVKAKEGCGLEANRVETKEDWG